ncbi:MAG: hypothetical protein U9O87_11400 [Verrucomicrobiota bacterium]|nr:hypothetical protein [Verrucomicrobiota bacterium]
MAKKEKGKKTESQEKLVLQLEELKTQVQQIESLRKKQASVARWGLLIILVFIIIFVGRGYKLAKNYDREILLKEILADSREAVKPEVQKFVADLKEQVLPYAKKQLAEGIQNEIPVFKEDLEGISDRLIKHTEDVMIKNLIGKIATELESGDAELKKAYSEFIDSDEFERQVKASTPYFKEKVTDMIEEKMAGLSSSVTVLQESLNKLQGTEDFSEKELSAEAESGLIEALLEVAIYSLNPAKGKELVKK